MQETRVQSLGQEDPLEKEMATHSSILAWRIPWTEEPGGLQSTGSQRVGHDWATSLSLLLYLQSRNDFLLISPHTHASQSFYIFFFPPACTPACLYSYVYSHIFIHMFPSVHTHCMTSTELWREWCSNPFYYIFKNVSLRLFKGQNKKTRKCYKGGWSNLDPRRRQK